MVDSSVDGAHELDAIFESRQRQIFSRGNVSWWNKNVRMVSLICVATIFISVTAAGNTLDEARSLHRAGKLDAAMLAYDTVAATSDVATDRATALNNACVILTDRGELVTAAQRCDRALRLRRDAADEWRVARTLNNVARVQDRLGNSDIARAHHREALEIYQRTEDHKGRVTSLINLGVLETNTKHHAQALKHYESAVALLDAVDDTPWVAYRQVLLALNRGVALEQIGAYEEALFALDTAISDAPDVAPGLMADLQMNRGVVLRNLGDPVAALATYREAVGLFEARADRTAIANVYLNQALVLWLDQHNGNAAIPLLRQARNIATEAGDVAMKRETTYFIVRAHLERGEVKEAASYLHSGELDTKHWFALDARARVAFALGDNEQALTTAMRALRLIENQRAALSRRMHRQSLLSDRRNAYALAINILFANYQQSGDPSLARSARAVAARAKALELIEATDIDAPLSAPDAPLAVGLDNTLTFFLGAKHAHAWTTDADAIYWHRYDKQSLERAAEEVHSALSHRRTPGRQWLDVLMPLLDRLVLTRTSITISADGLLALVPFEWLIALKTDGGPGPLSVRYSASLAATPVDNVPYRAPVFVALAYGQVADQTHPALLTLRPLPKVNSEAHKVAQYFRGQSTVLTNEHASETALRNLQIRAGSVLHIASHAVIDTRLDQGAVLVLSSSEGDDGLLFPRDVAELELPAALTVLSACSTAQGIHGVGAPVSNLTGAFLAAGSQAVLATLWPIDDATSAVVMDQFYAQLARGLSPAAALQATKTRLMNSNDWNAPWLWSGYVLYGDARPIVRTARHSRWPTVATLTLLILFVLLAWRQHRR
ncbi:MAG: CHAT domain-containing protein [Gammaproteobacteria bacterium]